MYFTNSDMELISGPAPALLDRISSLTSKKHNNLFEMIDKLKSSKIFTSIDKLMPRQRKDLMEDFEDKIKSVKKNLNTPKRLRLFGAGKVRTVWRTPLEYAVEKGLPMQVLMKLIEHGAHPTPTACSMVAIRINRSSENFNHIYATGPQIKYDCKVVELLSISGANWSDNLVGIDPKLDMANFYHKYQNKGHNENPIADFIIEKLGKKMAFDIGVSMGQDRGLNDEDYEVDLENFVNQLKNHRAARMKKENGIEVEVEVELKLKDKRRWMT